MVRNRIGKWWIGSEWKTWGEALPAQSIPPKIREMKTIMGSKWFQPRQVLLAASFSTKISILNKLEFRRTSFLEATNKWLTKKAKKWMEVERSWQTWKSVISTVDIRWIRGWFMVESENLNKPNLCSKIRKKISCLQINKVKNRSKSKLFWQI